ncbi:MAG: NlpC/P60 family protein [Eubacteriales bacterium]|nr:NlpC/P60 family protein [Eubacteriales bacterium]
MKYGIVKKGAAFLYETRRAAEAARRGQGAEEGGVSDEVFCGWSVRVLEEDEHIALVRTFYGYEGYMDRSALVRCRRRELRRFYACEGAALCVVTSVQADVQAIPRVQGRILLSVPRGSLLSVCGEEREGYLPVRLPDGQEGVVAAPRVREYPALEALYFPKKKEENRNAVRGAGGEWTERAAEQCDTQGQDGERTEEDAEQCTAQGRQVAALRRSIVAEAKKYLGTQYRWGGKSPEGIDCSGLAFMSYFMNGILIYRDADLVEGYPVHEIPREKLKQGDLIFFPGHVAVSLGGEKFIHSTGHQGELGVVYGSLKEGDPGYRPDLRDKVMKCGSFF